MVWGYSVIPPLSSVLYLFLNNTMQVLYRKYRPQQFKDFTAQKHVIQTLTNEIEQNKIAHAYLFSGHRGTGKTTMARLFAKAINCENRKGFEPCDKCLACKEINKGSAVDIIEIDAASNRGIDDIRALRDSIKYRPNLLKYKVLILDEAHQLSKDAANALLKILEEPPEYVVFILATTEAHKMISTISSRCQRFDFYKLTIKEIVSKLEVIARKEGIIIEKEALELIAMSADGALRDAEGILNQILNFVSKKEIEVKDIQEMLGIVDLSLAFEFTEFLVDRNISGAIKYLNEKVEKGLNVDEFSKTIINFLRKLLILKISKDLIDEVAVSETKETKDKLIELSLKFQEMELKLLLDLFLIAAAKIEVFFQFLNSRLSLHYFRC